ncbi:unnamed protein product [Brachionus calyciflorus]|uniref:Serine/threonine-protein phosphatase n=1 Tax=Brachionus calyciflorus TaxID=104777 RepID=A0A813TMV3_9BILA|nr:unnamed protein product [Brachionus calyciflorus]
MSSQQEASAFNALVELNEITLEQNYASTSKFFECLFAVYSNKINKVIRPELVETSYSGTHLSRNYELGDFYRMIESFRNNQRLHAKYALQIIEDAIQAFQYYPNITECNILPSSNGAVIVGDLHGSFKDLYYIISKYGVPGQNYFFIFNGDFVDRGPQQSEVLLTILYAYLMNPSKVFINRGNHEDLTLNITPSSYPNFKKDTQLKFNKFGLCIFNEAQRLFKCLPLATCVQNNVGLRYFVVHGGVSNRIDLNLIRSSQFNRFYYSTSNSNQQISDLLWSDPNKTINGCISNTNRGVATFFGPDVSEYFCALHRFNGIIRSHEVRPNGFSQDHKYCYTVFSSSRYCGGSNHGAVIVIKTNSHNIEYTSFDLPILIKDETQNEKIRLLSGFKSFLQKQAAELYYKFTNYDIYKTGSLNINQWAKIISDHIYNKLKITIKPQHIITLKDYLCPCNDAQQTAQYVSMFTKFSNQHKGEQVEFIKVLFNLIDSNGSGFISASEAYEAIKLVNKTFGTRYATDFITSMDTNKDDENGIEYVCAYPSRLLKGAELHYGITEKECLAVVWSVKKFRIYLYGNIFILVTDHSALLWLMKIRDANGRLARWAIYLQTYTFAIVHRSGKKHLNADALSRAFAVVEELDEELDTDRWEDEFLLHFLRTGKYLPGSSKKQCKKIGKKKDIFSLQGDKLLYWKNIEDLNWKIVPKIKDRAGLIKETHLLGHFGVEKTYKDLQNKYYWKGMYQDTQLIISNCMICIRHQKVPVWDHPAMSLPINDVMDRVQIYYVFGLPLTQDGYKGIAVFIEPLTKFLFLMAIKSKTGERSARCYFKFVSIFGPSKQLLSHQGKEFMNEAVDNMLKLTANSEGVEMKQSYPLNKLKIVSDTVIDNNEFYDIEKILKDRTRRGMKEYFMKWKGFPDEENSWVKESDFVSMDCLKEKSKQDTIPINRVNGNLKLSHNLFITLALFTIFLPLTFGKTIEGSSLEEVQLLGYKTYFIVGMCKYAVDGYGYKCSKKEVKITTFKSFFGARSKNKSTSDEVISKDECLAIVLSKKCHNNP